MTDIREYMIQAGEYSAPVKDAPDHVLHLVRDQLAKQEDYELAALVRDEIKRRERVRSRNAFINGMSDGFGYASIAGLVLLAIYAITLILS
jgi:hypothetical protein